MNCFEYVKLLLKVRECRKIWDNHGCLSCPHCPLSAAKWIIGPCQGNSAHKYLKLSQLHQLEFVKNFTNQNLFTFTSKSTFIKVCFNLFGRGINISFGHRSKHNGFNTPSFYIAKSGIISSSAICIIVTKHITGKKYKVEHNHNSKSNT